MSGGEYKDRIRKEDTKEPALSPAYTNANSSRTRKCGCVVMKTLRASETPQAH